MISKVYEKGARIVLFALAPLFRSWLTISNRQEQQPHTYADLSHTFRLIQAGKRIEKPQMRVLSFALSSLLISNGQV